MAKVKSNRGGSLAAQRDRAMATRIDLLTAARKLFAEAGYHATGTTEIAAQADMTRGALYHHFEGKEELFAEVFREVAQELVNRSNASVAPLTRGLWATVSAAFQLYLQLVAANEEYQRILLIDGPAVLGWARWRALQSEFVASGTIDALQLLMERGLMEPQPAAPLAYLIQAALNDAALSIAHAPATGPVRKEAMNAFDFLLVSIGKRALPDNGA
jgi:AcrR family transcriptional regulator